MNYKNGYYCKNKKYYCLLCNKLISHNNKSGLCRSCLLKKRFKEQRPYNYNKQKRKCKQCGKIELVSPSHSHRIFCSQLCYSKYLKLHPEETSRYNDGITLKKYYCIEGCGREICLVTWRYGNKRCIKCAHQGENSPRYKDGKGREPYAFDFNPKLKKSIHKRDNYKCQFCGMTEEEHLKKYNRVLEVHHKDHNRKNSKRTNLITACKKCNLER